MQSGRALPIHWLLVIATDTNASKLSAESLQCAGPSALFTPFSCCSASHVWHRRTSFSLLFWPEPWTAGLMELFTWSAEGGLTGDHEGAEPRRRPERAAHIGWRRGFARRIITSLTSLGLVVGMNNIARAEFSLHVALWRRGSRLCRWLLWNSAVSGGRTETNVVIDAFRWKKEKGVATQQTSKTNTLFSV